MDKNFRRFFCVLLTMALATFALPSFGAPGGTQFAKQYYITMTADALTPVTVVAHVSNVTQGTGNSTIGSFQLTVTGAKITGFNNGVPLSKGTATITNGGSTIFFTGIFPIKPGTTSDFI